MRLEGALEEADELRGSDDGRRRAICERVCRSDAQLAMIDAIAFAYGSGCPTGRFGFLQHHLARSDRKLRRISLQYQRLLARTEFGAKVEGGRAF